MSASTDSSATDVDIGAENEAPQLSALFLIRFDKKVGYTIAWKRTAVDVALDGAVEFKSLPSGLHALESDLVYFVHEGYAGLSAFAKGDASAEERNAQFVSVGILVSKAYGRLGRSWLLAGRLQKLAATLAQDPSAITPLEEFWNEQAKPKASASRNGGTKAHSRARALSTITAVIPSDQSLPEYHPALSMLKYVEVFGPLVFRLQQAALLRKRILFVGNPPVRTCSEFVYNLSVLSSIPPHAAELLSPDTEALLRLPSLFSVGVHDIPQLENLSNPKSNGNAAQANGEELPSQGWVACTTDEIFTTKKNLYDIIVEMPPTYDAPPQKRKWPILKTSDGIRIKASQRDLWRYKMLHRELWKHKHQSSSPELDADDGDDDDQAALLSRRTEEHVNEELDVVYDDSVIEPTTWTRLAYNGFMWWASAGEQHAYTTAERDRDLDLLGDLSDYTGSGLPTAIIAYFHRSTTLLVNSLNNLIERSDDEEEGDDDDDDVLVISKEDLSRMGLDTWSEADKAFLREFLWMWFGRVCDVRGASVDCCGVRIPVL